MIYQLLIYQKDEHFAAIFPELNFITGGGKTKEEARQQAIAKAVQYLKKQKTMPPRKDLVNILASAPEGSEKYLMQYIGMEFTKDEIEAVESKENNK